MTDFPRALESWRCGECAVWLSPRLPAPLPESASDLRPRSQVALQRADRFAPVLREIFPEARDWSGRVESALISCERTVADVRRLFVKADHDLPMTGSVKARGGVYELLCYIEREMCRGGALTASSDYRILASPDWRECLARLHVTVASTGNLGFSVGLVAKRFGLRASVHMSTDAAAWKKERLRTLGVEVIEHNADYAQTVAMARAAAQGAAGVHFIDDERSPELFLGYANVMRELSEQMAAQRIVPTFGEPLVAYLPCGVGGAPGGITYALKQLFGRVAICVFVEPIQSACMFAALSIGAGRPVSVYDIGLNNRTRADGLAVPCASAHVLDLVGTAIDAVVAVPDEHMALWARRLWTQAHMRLELSAAAGFAALQPFQQAIAAHDPQLAQRMAKGTHLVWTTGGSLQPEAEFQKLLEMAARECS